MEVRPATPDDLELLQHWDEQPHVIASDPNDDWSWETELHRSPKRRCFGADECFVYRLDRADYAHTP